MLLSECVVIGCEFQVTVLEFSPATGAQIPISELLASWPMNIAISLGRTRKPVQRAWASQ